MIISHKYKYIFIKPIKVAGTSVESALSKHCGSEDIITKINDYSKESDEDKYESISRNNKGFENHMLPKEIKKRIPKKIWNTYYKFTIVRNSWDTAVSRYFWKIYRNGKNIDKKNNKKLILKIIKNIINPKAYVSVLKTLRHKKNVKNIKLFLRYFDKNLINEKYYFDKKGNPICDFYIRYENLEEDYRKVCEHLGIPYEKLPRLKTKQRTEKKHYSAYYDEKAKKRIAKICKKEIKYFNYKFKKKK